MIGRWSIPLVAIVVTLAGCGSAKGPEALHIEPGRYDAAFDTASEVARAAGMPVEFRDRRAGVIATEPEIVGSLLEPWRDIDDDLDRTTRGTLAYQRRRARFSFAPVPVDAADDPGPDLLGMSAPIDLLETQGPMELRVRVYVEQAYRTGVRRSTWTRRAAANADIDRVSGTFDWVPVSRDTALERRLMARVADALESNAPE